MEYQVKTATPSTSILVAIRNDSNMSLWKALAEVIDNAFDKGASQVIIQTSEDSLTVEDDGQGCSDPYRMVQLGNHFRHAKAGNTIGRYGIGLKESSVWLCDRMDIYSTSNEGTVETVVLWGEMIASNSWQFNDKPINRDITRPTGTVITFSKIHSNRLLLLRSEVEQLVKESKP